MPIHVKSHRRGKSIVSAYQREVARYKKKTSNKGTKDGRVLNLKARIDRMMRQSHTGTMRMRQLYDRYRRLDYV